MKENYFTLFEIPVDFNVDLESLEKQYFLLQSYYHPDKASTKEEKTNFLRLSTELNNGYKVLKDELSRAIYLLSIQGIDIENCKSELLDQVLEEIWQDYEKLEYLSDSDELENYLDLKKKQRAHLIDQVSEAFIKGDNKDHITFSVLYFKYIDNLIRNICHKLVKLS